MQTVILAGGKGTRLTPYTTVLPKPLMPVGQLPVLELIVRQLGSFGFDRIDMATGYLSGLIEAYFGDGSRWGVQIVYHVEKHPAGTAGPIRLLSDALQESFIVMNGDVLTDLDFRALLEAHRRSGAILTIASCRREVTLPLGALVRGDHGAISDYVEKPTYEFECSSGIYAASKELVAHIGDGRPVDFPDLVRKLIAEEKHVEAFPIPGFWLDMGTPDDYRLANDEFANRFSHLL